MTILDFGDMPHLRKHSFPDFSGSLGLPWDYLGSLWVTFGLPLAPSGVALAPFGVPLGSLWGGLGSLWVSLARFGCPWLPLGALGLLWELNVHRLRCLCTKSSLLEHAAGATGATEVVSRTAAQSPPPTRAGGQDDGSYTNSLK